MRIDGCLAASDDACFYFRRNVDVTPSKGFVCHSRVGGNPIIEPPTGDPRLRGDDRGGAEMTEQ